MIHKEEDMKRKKQRKSAKAKHNLRSGKFRRRPSLKQRDTKRIARIKRRKNVIGRGSNGDIRRPTTARQYFAMSQKDRETWDSAAHVVTAVRDGVPLAKASKEFGIAQSTAIELGGPALRKRNGRYVATKTDNLLRVHTILSVKGKNVIATRDSSQASLVGAHWAAVQRYLQTGDDSALLNFKGKRVTDVSRKRHLLLTDLKELNRQASAGILSFESMYAGGL